jgi:FAD-dependent oxidoreductase domain-containing protein 1
MNIQHDVVIIGGGAIGCATAVFLRKAGVERVCVLEPDPTYAKAATPMATGGCRRLFALPENIRMSQFSIEYYKNFALQGFRHKAQAMGVTFLRERAVDLYVRNRRIVEIELASGTRVRGDHVVNAAGCWSASIAKLVGVDLPVNPMRRFEHYVELAHELPADMPLIKDPDRLIIRPEGKGYAVGLVKSDEPRGFNFEVEPSWFQDVVWPACAARVKEFEELKLVREWAGLYDECELDGNMILGYCEGGPENFLVACGFSGHGLMHAPAVGRALGELIARGRFETIELGNMGYERIQCGRRYPETGIL